MLEDAVVGEVETKRIGDKVGTDDATGTRVGTVEGTAGKIEGDIDGESEATWVGEAVGVDSVIVSGCVVEVFEQL